MCVFVGESVFLCMCMCIYLFSQTQFSFSAHYKAAHEAADKVINEIRTIKYLQQLCGSSLRHTIHTPIQTVVAPNLLSEPFNGCHNAKQLAQWTSDPSIWVDLACPGLRRLPSSATVWCVPGASFWSFARRFSALTGPSSWQNEATILMSVKGKI